MFRFPPQPAACGSLVLLLFFAPTVFASGLAGCLRTDGVEARSSCLRSGLEVDAVVEARLQEALRAADDLAELRLPLTDALAEARPRLSAERPDLQALALDVRGLALYEAGEVASSADAYRRSLELDDGTLRIAWFAGADRRWSASLDTGSARLERAARSMLAAGDVDEGRRRLARAVELGFDPAAADWTDGYPPSPTTPLLVRPWYKPLPDFDFDLINRELPFRLSELDDTVIVLDFWATWCAPCRRELPALQRFYTENGSEDLVVVTINVGEAAELALAFAAEIGLTLPIGRYEPRLAELFPFDGLPMLIVIDRKGRMRGRWDGYTDGLEEELRQLVEALLEEEEDRPGRELARIAGERPALEVRWMRPTGARTDGVDVVDVGDEPEIVAFEGRELARYRSDGRTLDRWEGPPPDMRVGRLASSDGPPAYYGFHPGGTAAVRIDAEARSVDRIELPAPVFDIEDAGGRRMWIATLEGLFEWAPEAAEPRLLDRRETFAVRDTGIGPLALGAAGELRRVRVDERSRADPADVSIPPNTWSLVGGASGWGAAGPGVAAAASGKLLPGPSTQIALLTESGHCVVLDESDGRVRWRARWPHLSDAAAGDLDGDGLDELVLVGRRRLVVLGAPRGDGRIAREPQVGENVAPR